MQRLPGDDAAGRPVGPIAHDRPARCRQVHANLVRAAGDQLAGHDRTAIGARQHVVAGFAGRAVGARHDPAPIAGVAPKRFLDRSRRRPRDALHDGQIFFAHAARVRVPLHGRVCGRRQRHQHQARGVLVEPRQHAGARRRAVPEPPQHRVQHGLRRVLVGGVHHDAGRLVDRQQVLVFEQDVERELFGCWRRAPRRAIRHGDDHDRSLGQRL